MDGVDAVLCRIEGQKLPTLSQVALPFPAPLLNTLHQLCAPGENELFLAGQADREIAYLYSDAVKTLLKQNNLEPADITAGDIIRVLEGPISPVEVLEDEEPAKRDLWLKIRDAVKDVLDSTTLDYLAEYQGDEEQENYMFYI